MGVHHSENLSGLYFIEFLLKSFKFIFQIVSQGKFLGYIFRSLLENYL